MATKKRKKAPRKERVVVSNEVLVASAYKHKGVVSLISEELNLTKTCVASRIKKLNEMAKEQGLEARIPHGGRAKVVVDMAELLAPHSEN